MKNALSLLLALVMLLSLAACGSSKEAPAVEKAETPAAETEEEITLRFVSWQTNHDAAHQAIAEAYHELHPNITVEFEYYGDMNSTEYLTKTDIMLMGGEEMDIVMTPSSQAHSVRAASGSYLGLDQFFEAEGTTAENEFNVLFRTDDVYGIPAEMKYTCVLLNKDMLDAAGLEVPSDGWTWDEYAAYARKLTTGSGVDTVYGSYFHSWGSTNLTGVGSAKAGNNYFNDDGTLTFENPEFADFLQFRYDLENVDKASTPLADVKALNMNYRDQFFTGKIAMLPCMGTFMLSDIGNPKYAHDFVTAFAPTPTWNEDDDHYYGASGNIFSIARTSTHPQEAFEFLKFWSTEGVTIKGMFVTNENGGNKMNSVNAIVGDFTELLDMDSLTAVMQDPKWVDSFEKVTPTYQSEVDTILTEETDKYLLGSQSLEDTVANLMKRGNEIIAENS